MFFIASRYNRPDIALAIDAAVLVTFPLIYVCATGALTLMPFTPQGFYFALIFTGALAVHSALKVTLRTLHRSAAI